MLLVPTTANNLVMTHRKQAEHFTITKQPIYPSFCELNCILAQQRHKYYHILPAATLN